MTLGVRGGSDAELEGACVDEGCRRSLIDEGLGADAPVVVADCDGRGAEDGAGFEDGDELEEGVVELRYPPVAELLLGSLSNEPKSYVDISPPYRSSSAARAGAATRVAIAVSASVGRKRNGSTKRILASPRHEFSGGEWRPS
ncbi:hypothetical protein [Botrimarina mediterranea]|uniref:hypothetical protein n=1 Tax=Botrimarina mediterranea TaxID=2528022 RepID=UPI00118B3E82|nr:hypothetical protein K2D_31680 [Planctomycetes bacterium K2D]